MQTPRRHRPLGLVDHDARLRHGLLGAFQVLCVGMVAASPLAALASPGPLDWRAFIPPVVLAIGTAVQFVLWRRHKDRIVSIAIIVSLLVAMAVGTALNGILAPSVCIPLLALLLAGYLLGRVAAWIAGGFSLAILCAGWAATRWGWLPQLHPPLVVWARVVAIQTAVSAAILAIPLRGLLSGIRRIEMERRGLDESTLSLERHRSHLGREVVRRTRELELANADLAAFSYALSHDLEEPLRSLRLQAKTVEQAGALTEQQRGLLRKILEESNSLENSLQEAIQLSRTEGSR